MSEGEDREAYRMPFSAKVICCVNENDFCGTTDNISATGLFMEAIESPPAASKCSVEIVIAGHHSCLRIEKIKGVIIRREKLGVGIRFNDRLEWIALVPIFFQKMKEELAE